MNSVEILNPINKKIQQWINYEENEPKLPYEGNEDIHNQYRKENDLDCKLTGGNLNADTIFSLWIPLRFSLVRLNGYPILNKIGDINNKIDFLNEFNKHDLQEFLPVNEPVVIKLSELFKLGMTRANVMILPQNRELSSLNKYRSKEPYYDYMPYFLYECFPRGDFSKYFNYSKDNFIKWIEDEKLEMFFELKKEISLDSIRDLNGTEKIKRTVPNEGILPLERMIVNYINILKIRQNQL